VGPVSQGGFRDLLGLRGQAAPQVPDPLRLSSEELVAVQSAADGVQVPDDVLLMLCELRDWCTAQEIAVSDRRWRKVVKLLQVSAWTNGRGKVSIWDCWLLQHCLWDQPEDREKVYDWYAARVGTSAAMDPSRLTRIVVSWEAKLQTDQECRSQMRDERGRPLYDDGNGRSTRKTKGLFQAQRDGVPLYLAPANALFSTGHQVRERSNGGKGFTQAELSDLRIPGYSYHGELFKHWSDRATYLADQNNWLVIEQDLSPMMEPTRHKAVYIAACLREVDQLKADVARYKAQLYQHIQAMEQDIRDHLWVTPDFVQPASDTLKATRQEVETLLSRVDQVRKGFELLPREAPVEAQATRPTKGT
jgi:MoxR-like ATPase